MDEGEAALGELVEAGEDAAIVLEKVAPHRDLVTFLGKRQSVARRAGRVELGRATAVAPLARIVSSGASPSSTRSEHGRGVEDAGRLRRSALLARSQPAAQRLARRVGDRVKLTGKAATRAARILVHRAKRWQPLFQGPSSAGSRGQGAPARAIHSTVSTNRLVGSSCRT